MINKTGKDRNAKVTQPKSAQDRKVCITRRTNTKSDLISGDKLTKSANNKGSKSKEIKIETNYINTRNRSYSKPSTTDVKVRTVKKDNITSKSRNIKKVKEIAKKVKTKVSNKVGKVAKRKLRNSSKSNSKITVDKKMKNNNNSNEKNKSSKQSNDSLVCNHESEKSSPKNSSTKINSTINLCTKLFPLNCVKSSNSKTANKLKKSDTAKNKLKTNTKNDKKDEKLEKCLSKKKSKVKDKKHWNTVNTKKKSNSSSNVSQSKVQNKTRKSNEKVCNESNSIKFKNKGKKVENKMLDNNKNKNNLKNGSNVKRDPRLASLNAIAKVRLLCENEREKSDVIEESFDNFVKQNSKSVKEEKKSKWNTNRNNKSRKDCKALVPVNDSKKKVAVRKRKMIDDSIEIIDTRSCKRMASLNASAIMAASYSPEVIKRSKSVESTHSNCSVEMVGQMQISSTVSSFQISPSVNGINGVHVSEAKSVILKAQKHKTIETVKKLKVSSKIKDRLLGIAKLERDLKVKKRKANKSNANDSDSSPANASIGNLSGAEVAGFQATKVQVTKVTQINTSQGVKLDKDKKSGHKIESILERDSSVVHKYQVQTKSTIQMQTTFNPSNASNMASVSAIQSPLISATGHGSTPRMQVHISGTPTQVIPTPILSTSNSGHPTYFNFPGPAPVLQLHGNQYHAMTPSASHVNPMSIISLAENYPTHYSSAFSVPHFATHTHPQTQTPFNYFHPGLYQPAGPLLQPFHDPCLIHKPIPFHPQSPPLNPIHSSQFPNTNLQTQSNQTFQNDMTQSFNPNTQFFQQFQGSIRPSQAVFFQALPQTNASLTPNATFTFVNPNLHYTQPTIINAEQFQQNENHLLTNDVNYMNISGNSCNTKISTTTTTNTTNSNQTSVAQSLVDNSNKHVCKGIQCSPQSKEKHQTMPENQFRDSTNQSVRIPQNTNPSQTVVTVRQQIPKKSNKSDNSDKKRSSLLKPNQSRKTDDLSNRSNTQVLIAEHQPEVSTNKSIKNALTPSNMNKNNSLNKNSSQPKHTKTVCLQVNTSLPSNASPSLPSPLTRVLPSRKLGKKRYSHGWSWEGMAKDKYVYLNNEDQSYLRKCYPSIRHNEGDIIKVRDCVLLRSGPRKTDLPFVAKIAALWETPEGEMMMSLLWYYRPEHTDLENYSNQMLGEIFASKHRDTNSVACIDDKCYVLTYNEFCRYKRMKLLKSSPQLSTTIVPLLDEPYPRADRIPPMRVFPELVFCCRKVYDYRQKRILKNPI